MTIGSKTQGSLKNGFRPARSRVHLTSGEMLRLLREKNELSQQQLAAASGLTQATISSLERGRINLGVERAKVLARVLHVHPATLVFPDWEGEESRHHIAA